MPDSLILPGYASLVPTDNCSIAAMYADYWPLSIVQIIQMLLSVLSLYLEYLNIYSFVKDKIFVHDNFKILMCSAGIIYPLHGVLILVANTRNQWVYHTYKDPCDLLMPTWVVLLIRAPCYLYVIVFSLLHVCIFTERALATFSPRKYSFTGRKYGIACTIVLWIVAIGCLCWIFSNENLYALKPYTASTSDASAPRLLIMHYVVLCLDVLVSIGDCVLYDINKKKLNKKVHAYDLSRNYQLIENIGAIRLILPLVFTHSGILFTYLSISAGIRQFYATKLHPVTLMALLESAYALIAFHACATNIVCLRCQKAIKPKAIKIVQLNRQAELYFSQFKAQISASESIKFDSYRRNSVAGIGQRLRRMILFLGRSKYSDKTVHPI
ncbi:serpentine type 7TM GPCR receptor class ab chemoreceptor domain-containing protein [Ditylenchus destructor]|uniref:Serpentine type 7TM GPCR receptor class ab chemoreceptor domain-containing protein n=1 Tax=Ditylenchus destructor TaxID=166010 RepID=A0AAD4R6S5_9BILA|nr:serpentine type 7TM GPCR receptor class ab chemoreceptor domain-containing protein [Ditylenchus destructor]